MIFGDFVEDILEYTLTKFEANRIKELRETDSALPTFDMRLRQMVPFELDKTKSDEIWWMTVNACFKNHNARISAQK